MDGPVAGFWGDLHGQTGETVGVNSIESYFDFARNLAFLDVTSNQGNDFQINAAFWAHLNSQTAAWNEPGRFTTLPGYEWSGNTAIGGDHNVFFRNEGRAIRRCSHALPEDRTQMHSDANTLTDLYSALGNEDCVIYAHVADAMPTSTTITIRASRPRSRCIRAGAPSNGSSPTGSRWAGAWESSATATITRAGARRELSGRAHVRSLRRADLLSR